MCGPNDNQLQPRKPGGADLNVDLMEDNNQTANGNRHRLTQNGVLCINLMSSPGTGKTTLLEKTLELLQDQLNIGVIEGDMTTEMDANRLRVYGVPVVAITTGRACHLDADMVAGGLDQLELADLDLIFIENVGNLICPAEYPLGEHANVVLVSVTEGEDKPLKYPVMFFEADCVVITKTDLSPYVKVDVDRLTANIRQIRPNMPVITLSAENGEGLSTWIDWLRGQIVAELTFSTRGTVVM